MVNVKMMANLFCLQDGNYSSEELYKRINMDFTDTIKDGFFRMISSDDTKNETLLIINAYYSGVLQKQLNEHRETKKSVSIWRNKKLWILVAFAAITSLCYYVSKYDKKCEVETKAAEKAQELLSDDSNGMDYATDLMERASGNSEDVNLTELKKQIQINLHQF